MTRKRTITGRIQRPDLTGWAGAPIAFKLQPYSYTDSSVLPRSIVSVTTDENGEFEADLWVNEEGIQPCEYRCRLPSGEEVVFVLPVGEGEISLPALIELGQPPAPSNDTLVTLIQSQIEQIARDVLDAQLQPLSGVAGTTLSALRVVVLSDDYELIYADSTNLDHAFSALGITTQAFNVATPASAVTRDRVSDSSWNWDIRKPIWLGQEGQLTQIFPTTGFERQVAQVLSPTDILFCAEEAIVWQ